MATNQNSNISTGQSSNLTQNTNNSRPQIDPQISGLLSKVEDLKKDFLTTFGIFSSFVTFLSIEVQIFKNQTDAWVLVGQSTISFALILLFATSINYISKDRNSWREFLNPLNGLILIFLIVGISSLLISGDKGYKKFNNSIEDKLKKDSLLINGLIENMQTFKLVQKKDSIQINQLRDSVAMLRENLINNK